MRRSKGIVVSCHLTAYVKSTITLSPSVMSTVRAGSVDTFTCARPQFSRFLLYIALTFDLNTFTLVDLGTLPPLCRAHQQGAAC